jgi:hypothetical protein
MEEAAIDGRDKRQGVVAMVTPGFSLKSQSG